MKTDINRQWVNQGTGEIKDGVSSIITDQDLAEKAEKEKNKKEGYDHYVSNLLPLPTLLQEEYGNFIHTRYESLLEKINYDTATAFRFIYLCSFMDYDTGYVIWKNRKIKNDSLIDLFNVSKNTISKIKNDLYGNDLIHTDINGYILINTEYSYRGSIVKDSDYKKQCTRIFNNSIQELYEKSNDSKEHKLLGKFILLLPYINIWHNIICLNPKEKKIEKLILPNATQLDDILKAGARNSAKTINELFKITVGGEKTILMVTDKYSVKMYLVNPRIYYGGNNVNELKETMGYFRTKGGIK